MSRIHRVTEDAGMEGGEPMDGWGRLRLVSDETVVVVPETRQPHEDGRCRWPRACASCDEELRAEAISWLRGLADDYFGYGFVETYTAGVQPPDVQILWRDPLGISRLSSDRSATPSS
jgi:hypothetical protein